MDLKDIPIETMYKYLLRDYRALQAENKKLLRDNRRLIEINLEEISSQSDLHLLAEEYRLLSKRQLQGEVLRLRHEIEVLKQEKQYSK